MSDKVRLSLITSYAGPRSEWLEDSHCAREAVRQPGVRPLFRSRAAQVDACGEAGLIGKAERWQAMKDAAWAPVAKP